MHLHSAYGRHSRRRAHRQRHQVILCHRRLTLRYAHLQRTHGRRSRKRAHRQRCHAAPHRLQRILTSVGVVQRGPVVRRAAAP